MVQRTRTRQGRGDSRGGALLEYRRFERSLYGSPSYPFRARWMSSALMLYYMLFPQQSPREKFVSRIDQRAERHLLYS